MKPFYISFLLIALLFSNCKEQINEDPTTTNPLEKLTNGNQRFLDNKQIHPHQNKQAIINNEKGQHPFAVVVTCSDSRVSPEIIFDQGLGDLFVVRNAGNLISDLDMGSIEYAVEHLNTKVIIVLGHTECGAVKAFVEHASSETKVKSLQHDHIEDIINTLKAEEEEKKVPEPHKNHLQECIIANIRHSTNLILKNQFLNQNEIQVIPMLYDIHTGKVITIK
ncbi:Carbonic anhydrase 2 [compost metagenome]